MVAHRGGQQLGTFGWISSRAQVLGRASLRRATLGRAGSRACLVVSHGSRCQMAELDDATVTDTATTLLADAARQRP